MRPNVTFGGSQANVGQNIINPQGHQGNSFGGTQARQLRDHQYQISDGRRVNLSVAGGNLAEGTNYYAPSRQQISSVQGSYNQNLPVNTINTNVASANQFQQFNTGGNFQVNSGAYQFNNVPPQPSPNSLAYGGPGLVSAQQGGSMFQQQVARDESQVAAPSGVFASLFSKNKQGQTLKTYDETQVGNKEQDAQVVKSKNKKQKKPFWKKCLPILLPLLCCLALAGLIIGLLFAFGVLGKKGGQAVASTVSIDGVGYDQNSVSIQQTTLINENSAQQSTNGTTGPNTSFSFAPSTPAVQPNIQAMPAPIIPSINTQPSTYSVSPNYVNPVPATYGVSNNVNTVPQTSVSPNYVNPTPAISYSANPVVTQDSTFSVSPSYVAPSSSSNTYSVSPNVVNPSSSTDKAGSAIGVPAQTYVPYIQKSSTVDVYVPDQQNDSETSTTNNIQVVPISQERLPPAKVIIPQTSAPVSVDPIKMQFTRPIKTLPDYNQNPIQPIRWVLDPTDPRYYMPTTSTTPDY